MEYKLHDLKKIPDFTLNKYNACDMKARRYTSKLKKGM